MSVITKIHILSKTGQILHIAAYYDVPDAIYDTSSVNDARVPASNRLTTAEINELKLGHIYEMQADVDVTGQAEADVKAYLESRYASSESQALNKYKREFSDYVGEAWDGSTWS